MNGRLAGLHHRHGHARRIAGAARGGIDPTDAGAKGLKIPQFGLSVVPRPGGDGMEVTELEPNGLAAEHGFKPADIILEVAGKKVATTGDLRTAIQAAEKSGKRTVLVRMKTGDATRYVTLPIYRG